MSTRATRRGIERGRIAEPAAEDNARVSQLRDAFSDERAARISALRGAAQPVPPSDAAMHGVNRGLVTAMPVAGAAVGGAFGSVLGPAGTAGGVALGGLAGDRLGNYLTGQLNIPTADDMPDDVRPFFFAGEVVGAGGAMLPAPLYAASMGRVSNSSVFGRFLNGILDTVQRNPRSVMLAEAGSLGGAALGEGVAESVAPGETGIRVGAGIVGGIVSPLNVTANVALTVGNRFKQAALHFNKEATRSRAAMEVQRIVSEFGEDPTALSIQIRELAAREFPGANRTAGQLSGSRALQAMEAHMIGHNAKFGSDAKRAAEDSIATMRAAVVVLEASGDPGAMRMAAELKRDHVRTLLSHRLAVAEQDVADAARLIAPTTPESRAALSAQADGILDKALKDARAQERQLWAAVPQDAGSDGMNIVAHANRVASTERLPEESLPGIIPEFIGRIAEEGTTVRELQIFRSRMLNEARKADKNGDAADARLFGEMAEAALDDLVAIHGPGSDFDEARTFSRELNDTFTRTFAGQTRSTGETGAKRIPPEVMIKRAVGTGDELGALRLREIRRAVEFGSPEAAQEMMGIQTNVLRMAAQEIFDANGQVSKARLDSFTRRYGAVLDEFPEVKESLASVDAAQRRLAGVAQRGEGISRAVDQNAALGRLLGGENPTYEVDKMLRGTNPQRDFHQLAVLAKSDSPEAVDGLRRAVIDSAFAKAGGDTDAFSFTLFRRRLTVPENPGQPSRMELMRKEGIITADQQRNLMRIIEEADKVESAMRAQPGLVMQIDAGAAIQDLVVRIGGVAGVSAVKPAGIGPGALILAQAGSRTARQVFEKIPMNKMQDVIIEASQNPQLMAALLAKPQSSVKKIEMARRINIYLWQAGLMREPQREGEE